MELSLKYNILKSVTDTIEENGRTVDYINDEYVNTGISLSFDNTSEQASHHAHTVGWTAISSIDTTVNTIDNLRENKCFRTKCCRYS